MISKQRRCSHKSIQSHTKGSISSFGFELKNPKKDFRETLTHTYPTKREREREKRERERFIFVSKNIIFCKRNYLFVGFLR